MRIIVKLNFSLIESLKFVIFLGDKTSMNESGAKMKNADDISCSTVHNRCFRSHDQCGVEENEGADSDSGLSCVWSGDTSPLYVRYGCFYFYSKTASSKTIESSLS